jgi:hypothetical protein
MLGETVKPADPSRHFSTHPHDWIERITINPQDNSPQQIRDMILKSYGQQYYIGSSISSYIFSKTISL